MIAAVTAVGATDAEIEANALSMAAHLFAARQIGATWYVGPAFKLVIIDTGDARPISLDCTKWEAQCYVGVRKAE